MLHLTRQLQQSTAPLQKEDVVKYLSKADHFQPGFCIAVRPEQKQVVLAVRGTKSLSDALTDMAGRRARNSLLG